VRRRFRRLGDVNRDPATGNAKKDRTIRLGIAELLTYLANDRPGDVGNEHWRRGNDTWQYACERVSYDAKVATSLTSIEWHAIRMIGRDIRRRRGGEGEGVAI
jgi:hypothetical protein